MVTQEDERGTQRLALNSVCLAKALAVAPQLPRAPVPPNLCLVWSPPLTPPQAYRARSDGEGAHCYQAIELRGASGPDTLLGAPESGTLAALADVLFGAASLWTAPSHWGFP